MDRREELAALQAENARLTALLESKGIDWKFRPAATSPSVEAEGSRLSPTEKIALFRKLFRGRTDVYPIRWESKTSGKSGYAPACANEWRAGICEKPRIKCSDCPNRAFVPVTDDAIYKHLSGEQTLGVYPLLDDDTCHFVAPCSSTPVACIARMPPRPTYASLISSISRTPLCFACGRSARAATKRWAIACESRARPPVVRLLRSRAAVRPLTIEFIGVADGIRTHNNWNHNPGLYR